MLRRGGGHDSQWITTHTQWHRTPYPKIGGVISWHAIQYIMWPLVGNSGWQGGFFSRQKTWKQKDYFSFWRQFSYCITPTRTDFLVHHSSWDSFLSASHLLRHNVPLCVCACLCVCVLRSEMRIGSCSCISGSGRLCLETRARFGLRGNLCFFCCRFLKCEAMCVFLWPDVRKILSQCGHGNGRTPAGIHTQTHVLQLFGFSEMT